MLRGRAAVALVAFVLPLEASADSFGRCAQQGNSQLKIAACAEASRLTSYPRVLRWVYREMARAHRERGEIELARLSYLQSLAAREDEVVRREMQELPHPSAVMPGMGLNGAAAHPAFLDKRHERTRSGLWPSDHAGLGVKLRLPQPAGH